MATWESTRACSGNLLSSQLVLLIARLMLEDETTCKNEVPLSEFKQVP